MSRNEIQLCALELLGKVWDQELQWGDNHSDEMIKGDGLKYVASKITQPFEIGQSCALKALCFISRFGCLIPEFLALGVTGPILNLLHSTDPSIKLYCAEIIKNFTTNDQLLQSTDVKFTKLNLF